MKCGVCSKGYRKGTIVWVQEGGGLVRKRACADCAASAILLLARETATTCKCGKSATQCHVCGSKKETAARKDGADVKAIVKKLRAFILTANEANARMSEDVQTDHWNGRIEGLESAIELLESGRW